MNQNIKYELFQAPPFLLGIVLQAYFGGIIFYRMLAIICFTVAIHVIYMKTQKPMSAFAVGISDSVFKLTFIYCIFSLFAIWFTPEIVNYFSNFDLYTCTLNRPEFQSDIFKILIRRFMCGSLT